MSELQERAKEPPRRSGRLFLLLTIIGQVAAIDTLEVKEHLLSTSGGSLADVNVAVSAGLLEGVRRSENGLLLPVPAHQHHADRQTLRTAAGHRYGRVMGQVERVRIGEVVQRLVNYL